MTGSLALMRKEEGKTAGFQCSVPRACSPAIRATVQPSWPSDDTTSTDHDLYCSPCAGQPSGNSKISRPTRPGVSTILSPIGALVVREPNRLVIGRAAHGLW